MLLSFSRQYLILYPESPYISKAHDNTNSIPYPATQGHQLHFDMSFMTETHLIASTYCLFQYIPPSTTPLILLTRKSLEPNGVFLPPKTIRQSNHFPQQWCIGVWPLWTKFKKHAAELVQWLSKVYCSPYLYPIHHAWLHQRSHQFPEIFNSYIFNFYEHLEVKLLGIFAPSLYLIPHDNSQLQMFIHTFWKITLGLPHYSSTLFTITHLYLLLQIHAWYRN